MSGRRSHLRFTINPAPEGVLRILNDVVVQPPDNSDMVAISRAPGIVGEVVALQIVAPQRTTQTVARSAESRPFIADGTVRHRLRLEHVEAAVEAKV